MTVQLKSSELIVSFAGEANSQVCIPATLARRGIELKLILNTHDSEPTNADPVLLKLVAHARLAQQGALTGRPDPIVAKYSNRPIADIRSNVLRRRRHLIIRRRRREAVDELADMLLGDVERRQPLRRNGSKK